MSGRPEWSIAIVAVDAGAVSTATSIGPDQAPSLALRR
jgi:hypothetical protein